MLGRVENQSAILRGASAMKQNQPEHRPATVVDAPPPTLSSIERRAVAALSGIFSLRMLGLFMFLPVFSSTPTSTRDTRRCSSASPSASTAHAGGVPGTVRRPLRSVRTQAGDRRRPAGLRAGQRGRGAGGRHLGNRRRARAAGRGSGRGGGDGARERSHPRDPSDPGDGGHRGEHRGRVRVRAGPRSGRHGGGGHLRSVLGDRGPGHRGPSSCSISRCPPRRGWPGPAGPRSPV